MSGPGDPWPGASVSGNDLGARGLSRAIDYAEHMQSLSLLVWRHGRLQYEHYWGGTGPDTRTETYSMAKSVVALAVGLAVADGAIGSVDDAAAKYLPRWRGTRYESIRVRDLLTMTSGLEFLRINYGFEQSPWNPALRTLLGPDLVGPLLEWPLREVPGATFAYNSANTELLLAVLENATGERYASYLSRRLWQPLGAAPATLWLDRPGGTPRAFAYLNARPRDWLRLGVLLAQAGQFANRQIVPAAWIHEMMTPSPANPNYGFQIWLGSPPAGRRAYKPRARGIRVAFGAVHRAGCRLLRWWRGPSRVCGAVEGPGHRPYRSREPPRLGRRHHSERAAGRPSRLTASGVSARMG